MARAPAFARRGSRVRILQLHHEDLKGLFQAELAFLWIDKFDNREKSLTSGLQWTFDISEFWIGNVRIPLRCSDILMPKKFLNITNIRSIFNEVCGKRMSERVKSSRFLNSRFFKAFFKYFCNVLRFSFVPRLLSKQYQEYLFRQFDYEVNQRVFQKRE